MLLPCRKKYKFNRNVAHNFFLEKMGVAKKKKNGRMMGAPPIFFFEKMGVAKTKKIGELWAPRS